MKPSWNHADYDRCTHQGCDKFVNNKQMRCAEHRVRKCRRGGCKTDITKGLYCHKHSPSGQTDTAKEFMIEVG